MYRLISIVLLAGGVVLGGALLSGFRSQAQGPPDKIKLPVSTPVDDESKIKRGLEIAPLPLHLRGRNRALIGLGSYIVNAQGDCNGCHSVDFDPYLPGGNPFFGEPEEIDPDKYLVGGSFFGPFRSRNLRPHANTGLPAGYTFEEFLHVMSTGEDLKNLHPEISPLLQVMPWPSFRNMTDRDILAIYEYLRALPPRP